MTIRAVIFDMDGILIDSENLWQQSEVELFGELGIDLTQTLLQQTRGLVTRDMVNHWCDGFYVTSVAREELMKRYDDQMVENMRTRVPMMEGAREAVGFFREKGLPVALASCSTHKHIDAVLERHKLKELFSLVVSASGIMPGKPHPEIYLHTAQKLGVDPTRCLAIEDSFFGVVSALAARMKVLAMPDPHEYGQSRFDAAHLKIRSLREINDELFNKLSKI
ncbi:MAG: hexitol phosphatase HxpB [Bacteroidota bacterium]